MEVGVENGAIGFQNCSYGLPRHILPNILTPSTLNILKNGIFKFCLLGIAKLINSPCNVVIERHAVEVVFDGSRGKGKMPPSRLFED